MIKKSLLVILFILGLVYILVPGPKKIEDFPALLNSRKSDEPGDTIQNPNIAAYYSFFRRSEITNFYQNFFENQFKIFGISIPSVRLNYPPEYAFIYVRDQQQSTFLEEYVFPMRDSVFVNGFEPLIKNRLNRKKEANFFDNTIHLDGVFYNSKTTIRFYPSNPMSRVFIYILIWIMGYFLFKLYLQTLKEY